jgi:hypothetical protein
VLEHEVLRALLALHDHGRDCSVLAHRWIKLYARKRGPAFPR